MAEDTQPIDYGELLTRAAGRIAEEERICRQRADGMGDNDARAVSTHRAEGLHRANEIIEHEYRLAHGGFTPATHTEASIACSGTAPVYHTTVTLTTP